ncbi:MAG: response regulator, partial [Campylobacterota bacterium]|nr:response regulator [Campylobacterota bacterium]
MTSNVKELTSFSKMLKVLYVEDNKEARESMIQMLNNFFDDITIAKNGYEGLKKFKKNKESKEEKQFSIIISDINMPKMDGIDMIKAIRDIDNVVDIIIVSAYSEKNY